MDRHVSIGRRLRFLRGDETQEVFSKRIGVSRSSLANYETGRAVPDRFKLDKIAKACGVSPAYFLEPNDEEPGVATLVGAIVEGRPDFTEDELAFVRLLRTLDPDTIVQIVESILHAVSTQPMAGHLTRFLHLEDDVMRLDAIREDGGHFDKGDMYVEGEKVMARIRAKKVPQ